MRIYREFRRVETEREAVGEWTSEGGFERADGQVEVDGTPPVIHRGTYDGTCKRVDIFTNVNLGGIAEVYDAFVPYIWGKGVFFVYLMSQAFRYEFGLDEVLAHQPV